MNPPATENYGSDSWDLSGLFPEVGSAAYEDEFVHIEREIEHIKRTISLVAPLNGGNHKEWIALFVRLQAIEKRVADFWSFHYCRYREDSISSQRKAGFDRITDLRSMLDDARISLLSTLRESEKEQLRAIVNDGPLHTVKDRIERIFNEANRLLPLKVERIINGLERTAMDSWEALYDKLSSQLTFEINQPNGNREQVPISYFQALQSHSDPERRASAFAGLVAAWESIEIPVAACLNGIVGMRLEGLRHRAADDFLDSAMVDHRMERASIRRMFSVIEQYKPALHQYLKLKARLMKKTALGYQDLFARVPQAAVSDMSLADAKQTIVEAFQAASPSLAATANRVFQNHWLETGRGKGRGFFGFCVPFFSSNQVRVFSPYSGSFTDATVLAHELGHAYHVQAMHDLDYWNTDVSMPLAETASNVGEGLLRRHLEQRAGLSDEERLGILEIRLSKAARALLFWSVLYEFEYSLHCERENGEVSVARLKTLMREAHVKWYGDALAEGASFDLLWAHVPLYYMSSQSFHSLSYIFGFLFSENLLNRLSTKAGFDTQYEALLRQTGSMAVEELVKTCLDLDLAQAGFWEEAIEPTIADLDDFAALIDGMKL